MLSYFLSDLIMQQRSHVLWYICRLFIVCTTCAYERMKHIVDGKVIVYVDKNLDTSLLIIQIYCSKYE